MVHRLPPLTWLRAFEAAGRLASFRAAADELHVTPSTVSHHVRDLEQRLGVPLFQRSGAGVCLTREGAAYLRQLSAGFEALAGAAAAIALPGRPATLRLGAFPFLTSEVLVPGLAGLRERLPGVKLSVVSDTRLSSLTLADPGQRLDAVVRYGNGRFFGCRARKLTDVSLVPVAAPGLLAGVCSPVRRKQLLARTPRITVAGPFDGWRRWTESPGGLPVSDEELSFDSYPSAMRATEQGLGIGLGLRPFVDGWLGAGRLAVVVERPVPAPESSYLVTPLHAPPRPELDVLEGWLLERFS